MGEGAVRPVLGAVATRVRLVDAGAGLVVAQVVLALRVPGRPVQVRTPGGRGRCASGPRGHRGVHLPPAGWLALAFPRRLLQLEGEQRQSPVPAPDPSHGPQTPQPLTTHGRKAQHPSSQKTVLHDFLNQVENKVPIRQVAGSLSLLPSRCFWGPLGGGGAGGRCGGQARERRLGEDGAASLGPHKGPEPHSPRESHGRLWEHQGSGSRPGSRVPSREVSAVRRHGRSQHTHGRNEPASRFVPPDKSHGHRRMGWASL